MQLSPLRRYFGWLNLKDEKEVEWGIRYLEKKNVFPSANLRDRDQSFFTYLSFDIEADPDRYALLLDRMKKAYTSRGQRRGPGIKPVSYLMSTTAKIKLASLAKGKKEIEILESLIFDAEQFRKECGARLNEQKAELEKRFEAKEASLVRRFSDEALLRENERLRQDLAKAKAEGKKSDNLFKGATYRATELEVKASIDEHVKIQLSPEEEEETKKRYMAKLRYR